MGYEEDSGINRECKFFVARSADFRSQRTILKEGKMFFDSYQVDEKTVLKLPLDNLEVLYMLNAWEYPACYGDSDLIDYATFPDKKGNLIKKKLNWYEKNFLQKKFH